jgi:CRISPR-associated protein Cas1
MAWRGIHLSRPAYLCLENRALRLEFRDETGGSFRIALEDLSYLILDTAEVSLSGTLLSALSEASVMVLGTDRTHTPCWVALPWTGFYKQGETVRIQIDSTLPQRKQLWSHIVRTKLHAQARCLFTQGLAGGDHLLALADRVRSGDPDNVEARAARHYWKCLFPEREFLRHADDLPNALLNYGYALLRAALARNLCALGFIPQLGIHHKSLTNAYNLADDLIEPYRPLADHFARETLGDSPSDSPFETDHRRSIVRLLEANVILDGEVYGTMAAIEATISSLRPAIQQKNARLLKFPDFYLQ